MTNDHDATIYHEVPGGTELLRWFGQAPNFHDAEILSLDLRRKGQSTLCLHGWIPKCGASQDGVSVLDRHAIVTFSLEGVMDVQLDGFNAQNVVDSLILRYAPDRPERRSYLVLDPLPQDIEIELEPCYGLHGLIRARSVFITFQPGSPKAQDL